MNANRKLGIVAAIIITAGQAFALDAITRVATNDAGARGANAATLNAAAATATDGERNVGPVAG